MELAGLSQRAMRAALLMNPSGCVSFPSYPHQRLHTRMNALAIRQEKMMGLPGGHIELIPLAQLQKKVAGGAKTGFYLH